MYEYTTLPNSWEAESLSWDHYYAESNLGSPYPTTIELDTMAISVAEVVAVMEIEAVLDPAKLPKDVYDVYLRRHFEGKDLPCKQLS